MIRVASLLPATTEFLMALGARDRLVARTHECDYPDSAAEAPVCTEPKALQAGAAYNIHERDRAIVQEALSPYRVDAWLLRDLHPGVILTRTDCALCGVNREELVSALHRCMQYEPRLIEYQPLSLHDVWQDVFRMAEAVGLGGRAAEAITPIQQRMAGILHQALSLMERPRVLCLTGLDPPLAAGYWIPELVEMAGGKHLVTEPGKAPRPLGFETLQRANPDLLVIAEARHSLDQARDQWEALVDQPPWRELRAVQQGRVYVMDGLHYLHRPGPRLIDALEALAELIQPAEFQFGHQDVAWSAWQHA